MGREIWYRATVYGTEPEAVEVVRRNKTQLWVRNGCGERRTFISTTWFRHFPTLDEALAFIATNRTKRQAVDGASLLREACVRAAPKLYDALELILADKGNRLTVESYQLGMAALAGARGELPCPSPT